MHCCFCLIAYIFHICILNLFLGLRWVGEVASRLKKKCFNILSLGQWRPGDKRIQGREGGSLWMVSCHQHLQKEMENWRETLLLIFLCSCLLNKKVSLTILFPLHHTFLWHCFHYKNISLSFSNSNRLFSDLISNLISGEDVITAFVYANKFCSCWQTSFRGWDSPLDPLYTLFFEKERLQALLDTGQLTCDEIHQSPRNLLIFLYFSNLILKRQKLL